MGDLQTEIHAWHLQNYPHDDKYSALLGVGEELGELMRCELKQAGGIRGTYESWQLEKQKEAGDVFIGLLNYASFRGVGIPFVEMGVNSKTLTPISSPKLTKVWLLYVGKDFGNIVHSSMGIELALKTMWWNLEAYCQVCGFNATTALTERWTTISKRDFIANPKTGGRENE